MKKLVFRYRGVITAYGSEAEAARRYDELAVESENRTLTQLEEREIVFLATPVLHLPETSASRKDALWHVFPGCGFSRL